MRWYQEPREVFRSTRQSNLANHFHAPALLVLVRCFLCYPALRALIYWGEIGQILRVYKLCFCGIIASI